MLLWINGAFGAGKTQTAFELQRRITDSHVADPELIGFAIHKMLPALARGDFQDRPQWRSAVIATLADAAAAHQGPTIVPMTLVNDAYFDEVMSGLNTKSTEVQHFSLIASPDTLRRRLRTRSAYWPGGGDTWAVSQIDRCVAALRTPRYAQHISTDGRSVDEVVEQIAIQAGLTLTKPRLSTARYQLRRAAVGVRHIRF